jgi:hypothetical protein
MPGASAFPVTRPSPGQPHGAHGWLGLLGLLLPVVTAGQGIDVERSDLYLRGGRLASGSWGCGFAILANHRTRDDPHVERDISVEQVNNGSHIATGVTAASFTVSHKARQARTPVTHLSFAIDQDPEPIDVRFEAAGADGVAHAALATDDATRLYAAVDAGTLITLNLDYEELPADSLRFRFVPGGATAAHGALAQLCTPVPAAHR